MLVSQTAGKIQIRVTDEIPYLVRRLESEVEYYKGLLPEKTPFEIKIHLHGDVSGMELSKASALSGDEDPSGMRRKLMLTGGTFVTFSAALKARVIMGKATITLKYALGGCVVATIIDDINNKISALKAVGFIEKEPAAREVV